MQAVAAWLVARPLNAVLALAATISLAWFSFLSGIVLVLLILHKDFRVVAIDVVGAAVLMVVVGVIAKVPLTTVIVGAFAIWLPAMLLASVLKVTRSLTLTLQISVLIAVVATLGFFLLAGEPGEFWRTVLTSIVEVWRNMGLTEQAALLDAEMDTIVEQMTMVAVITSWTVHVASCVLGYKLFRQLPNESARFGRFRDLNFGRVIALLMALASIGAYLSGAVWLQNTAFVMFAVFWMQGLAIVHWLHGEGHMPIFGVVAVYVLMPFLNVILLVGLAITGYIDAWFGFRRLRVVQ
ncbi:MAG: YybS family protein [Gammaproteobacteria bacterium]|nr:YybS family protein [Gammaproteobacteria bacterium]